MRPLELYARGLESSSLQLRGEDGSLRALPVARWLGDSDFADEAVLARAPAPVLDVGCGPGRHLEALARRGITALGVDPAPAAVRLARRRGVTVLQGSIFGQIPNAGGWGGALILDGNLGIGGDPGALLRRVAQLVRPAGTLLLELDPPGTPTAPQRVSLESAGRRSGPFRWAQVGADAAGELAAAAGLVVVEEFAVGGRWFAQLVAAADLARAA